MKFLILISILQILQSYSYIESSVGLNVNHLCKNENTQECNKQYSYQCSSKICTINKESCYRYETFSFRFRTFNGLGIMHMKKYSNLDKQVKKCVNSFRIQVQPNQMCSRNPDCTNFKTVTLFLKLNVYKKECTCSNSFPFACIGLNYCFKEKRECELFKKSHQLKEESIKIKRC